jgi:hypothetical protein
LLRSSRPDTSARAKAAQEEQGGHTVTRFEALGVLPDKWVTAFQKDADGNLKQAWRADVIRFVDELPLSGTFRIAFRLNQPRLGYLLKWTSFIRDGKFAVVYFRADQRKLKRCVKRYGWKLPAKQKKEAAL